MIIRLRLTAILLVVVALSQINGCTSVPTQEADTGPGEEYSPPPQQSKPEINPADRRNQVTLALLDNALRQAGSGDLEIATATLERALRIEPRNPLLWHHLALIRLQQGKLQLAASLAAKSNSLIKQDPELMEKNQRIIEQARGGF